MVPDTCWHRVAAPRRLALSAASNGQALAGAGRQWLTGVTASAFRGSGQRPTLNEVEDQQRMAVGGRVSSGEP